jgi:hypothetical protein
MKTLIRSNSQDIDFTSPTCKQSISKAFAAPFNPHCKTTHYTYRPVPDEGDTTESLQLDLQHKLTEHLSYKSSTSLRAEPTSSYTLTPASAYFEDGSVALVSSAGGEYSTLHAMYAASTSSIHRMRACRTANDRTTASWTPGKVYVRNSPKFSG